MQINTKCLLLGIFFQLFITLKKFMYSEAMMDRIESSLKLQNAIILFNQGGFQLAI
jgi:hypothetical protein